jgi:hypothetical protein
MKKGTSISLVILIIIGILHLSIANHYCGGKIAASKLSSSGHLANCGMEANDMTVSQSGISFTNRCCEDVVISYTTDSYYVPSFPIISDSYHYEFQIFSVPALSSFNSITNLNSLNTNVKPPRVLMSTHVDLSDICVFRI